MTVKVMHQEWAAKVMPHGAPETQRAEMERAFYAGFFSSLAWQLEHVAMLPDDKAVERMEAAHQECENYFRTLGEATRDISRS